MLAELPAGLRHPYAADHVNRRYMLPGGLVAGICYDEWPWNEPQSDTMFDRPCENDVESVPVPKGWTGYVRNAVLTLLGLVRIAMLAGREFLIDQGDTPRAKIYRLESEISMLREELRIKGQRTRRIDPHR